MRQGGTIQTGPMFNGGQYLCSTKCFILQPKTKKCSGKCITCSLNTDTE